MSRGFSEKQKSILKVIMVGNEDGTDVDMDQLINRVNYKTTKESMQFSLRALIKRGYVEKLGCEKRRGHSRRLIRCTEEARLAFENYLPFVPDKEPS